MAINKLTKNLNYIQALSDRPNTADGITSSQLKELFDQAGNDIKEYLNNTMIPSIEEELSNQTNDIENKVSSDDERLVNSRPCNNSFDSYIDARNNLHITSGTNLPSSGQEDDIFLLY